MAMTLSSLARTKLILATADRETATWCSDVVGHREVREMEEGYSYGYNNARDAVSLTPRRQVVPLLLPDEFMELPSLTGFIKFPDGFPAAPVTLVPCDRPRLAEGFIARELPSRTRVARCSDTDPTEIREGDDDPAEGEDEGGEPRRLARKERPASDPQTARVRGKRVAQSGVSKSGVPAKRAVEKAPSPTDPAPDARLAARPTEKAERQHHAQSELPLDDAKESPKERGNLNDSRARPDVPDPQAAQEAARDRNWTDRGLQEHQQRTLLGGAARDQQERDMGDIDPDI
jgi:hypothetical protein